MRDGLAHAGDRSMDRVGNNTQQPVRPARIGRALSLIVEDAGADHAGTGFQIGCKSTGDAKADQPAAAGCHCARERGREIVSVAAADNPNAKTRCDAGLEDHPHHHNHSAAPPRGHYIPKDTARLFPLFRLR